MSKFKLSVYPARLYDSTSTEIAITNCLGRVVVDCAMADLPGVMRATADDFASNEEEMPSLFIIASPDGRAPNGYRQFEAKRLHEVKIDRQPLPASKQAAIDSLLASDETGTDDELVAYFMSDFELSKFLAKRHVARRYAMLNGVKA